MVKEDDEVLFNCHVFQYFIDYLIDFDKSQIKYLDTFAISYVPELT